MLTRRQLVGTAAASLVANGPAWAAAPTGLGAIRAVTITSGDVALAEHAWTRFMDYRVVDRGQIPREVAQSWRAPAVAGRAYVALRPASGEPTVLRFVDQAMPAGYSPVGALGWSTTEITVQNSDRLYDRIQASPFKILHPPHVIPTYPYLKAMQAEGPSGERLNLTWINPPQPGIAVAKSFVGRCFIAVQGTPDLPGDAALFPRHVRQRGGANPRRAGDPQDRVGGGGSRRRLQDRGGPVSACRAAEDSSGWRPAARPGVGHLRVPCLRAAERPVSDPSDQARHGPARWPPRCYDPWIRGRTDRTHRGLKRSAAPCGVTQMQHRAAKFGQAPHGTTDRLQRP